MRNFNLNRVKINNKPISNTKISKFIHLQNKIIPDNQSNQVPIITIPPYIKPSILVKYNFLKDSISNNTIFDFKIYNGYLNSGDVFTKYTDSKKVLSSLSSNLDFYVVPLGTDPLGGIIS